MSIKTSKRIALGVITALVFAPFAAIAPASAAGEELEARVNASAITASSVTTTPRVGTASYVKFGASLIALTAATGTTSDTVTFKAALTTIPSGGSVGVTSVLAANAVPAGTATAVAVGAGTAPTLTASSSLPKFEIVLAGDDLTAWSAQTLTYLGAFTFTPTKAGDYVMTIWNDANKDDIIQITETFQTVTVTVTGALGFSQSLSSSFINPDNATNATSDQEVRVSSAAGTNGANIQLTLKNTANGALGGLRVSADVTGPGLVNVVTGAAAAYADATTRASALTLAAGVSAASIHVTADGTSGTSTINIKIQDATTLATLGTFTETMYFFGTVATLQATANYTIARANATARGCSNATTCDRLDFDSTPFIEVVAKDANGNLVTGLTVTAVITDIQTISASAVTAVTSTAVAGPNNLTAGVSTDTKGLGYYNASITAPTTATSGSSTTVKYRTAVGTTNIDSNSITLTVGGSPSTNTLSFDKATYGMGEAMVITRSAVDSSGNPVFDGATAPAVIFNKGIGGTAPAAGIYVGGKLVTSATRPAVFAPSSYGEFEARMTGAVAGTTSAIVAKASVPAPAVPTVGAV